MVIKLNLYRILAFLCFIVTAATLLYSIFTSNKATKSHLTPRNVERNIEECMRMANLDSEPLLTQAKENARYFYDEYRKAIPEKGLSGYRSHCWREDYFTKWNAHGKSYSGSLGEIAFPNTSLAEFHFDEFLKSLTKQFPTQTFKSSVVCVPNVFMAGFSKCGTTYLFSFIERLISMSTKDWEGNRLKKEMEFWIRFVPYKKTRMYKPKVEHLGRYLMNYIPGIKKIAERDQRDVVLVEGTANTIRDWPRFTEKENNLTNYCLIPATLPRLFPDSKFIAIMRNPIDMVYSQFWFSCTKINDGAGILDPTIGPKVFHRRMMSKIHTFNACMKDESSLSTSHVCTLDSRMGYAACIKQRLHLLDKCYSLVVNDIYTPELPNCGSNWLSVAIYYVNVRKWLKLVPRERMLFLTLEELKLHPSEVAGDILQFLDLDTSVASSTESMEKILQVDQRNLNSQETVDYKNNPLYKMREDTRFALEVFYHPFNTLLAELLDSDKFMWF